MLLRECKCGTKAYDDEDLELFVIGKKNKYGRQNICKKCYNIRNRERNRVCACCHRIEHYKEKNNDS